MLLQGNDRHGRPVMVVYAARHDMHSRDPEETKRFICYVLDNVCAMAAPENQFGQFLCLFDLAGGSWSQAGWRLQQSNLALSGISCAHLTWVSMGVHETAAPGVSGAALLPL